MASYSDVVKRRDGSAATGQSQAGAEGPVAGQRSPGSGTYMRESSTVTTHSLLAPGLQRNSAAGFLVIASIDLGTTYSGYAFAFRNDPQKVYASCWQGVPAKTPTSLLLEPSKAFYAFGHEADEEYGQLMSTNEHRHWYYYKNFKMELYNRKKLTRDSQLKEMEGKSMLALDVFAIVIRYMKDKLTEEARFAMTSLEDHEILWILTVPAIWSDAAKQFMKEAAHKAGIDNGTQLRLMLEPEAASIYCQTKFTHKTTESNTSVAKLEHLKSGHKYIVGDCGGGTADLGTHEVLAEGQLREIHRANGAALGGNRVNMAFEAFLDNLLTKEVTDRFKEHHRNDYLDLLAEFELKKRGVKFQGDRPLLLKWPPTFSECYTGITGCTVQTRVIEGNFSHMLSFRNGRLAIETNLLRVFFEEPVGEIIALLTQIIESQKFDIQTLFLVGGFSESPYVVERIKNDLQASCPKLQIVRPPQPNLHVLKGAVVSVVLNSKIVERKSRYTYGFRSRQPFDSDRYPVCLRDADGFCQEVFQKYIAIDQVISLGKQLEKVQFTGDRLPHRKDEETWLDIFKSENADPVVCTEEGCSLAGRVKLKPPEGGWPRSVVFDVYIKVRESDFHITVISGSTGETLETTVDFLV